MSPLILAVDTTHEFGSLALARGDRLLEEMPLHEPSGFAHAIFSHLAGLLSRNAVSIAGIDCFAAASGPGSFTGVRVGLACIKGLAEAVGRPAAAVSNLQALGSFGTAALRATLLDARRGEIYGAVYDSEGRAVQPEAVTKLEQWLERLPGGDLEFISPDFSGFLPALAGRRMVTAPRALAGAVAHLAFDRLRRGEACDPAALDANYVRRSDAELYWKE